MKALKLFLSAAIMIALTACSGGYSKTTCEELQNKIQEANSGGDELTQKDYSTMLDQMHDIAKEVEKKKKECDNDPAASLKLMQDEDFMQMVGYIISFGQYLSQHPDKLDADNIKKLQEIKEETLNF